MSDCTPEIKSKIAPPAIKAENTPCYQSYTAMSVKYPETPCTVTDTPKDTPVVHSTDVVCFSILLNCCLLQYGK